MEQFRKNKKINSIVENLLTRLASLEAGTRIKVIPRPNRFSRFEANERDRSAVEQGS